MPTTCAVFSDETDLVSADVLELRLVQAKSLIRREALRAMDDDPILYLGPEGEMPFLDAAAFKGRDPWPVAKAMRRHAQEVQDAAGDLDLHVQDWIARDPEVEARSRKVFPDLPPIWIEFVVLSAGRAIARAEYEAKLLSMPAALENARAGRWGPHQCFPHQVLLAWEISLGLVRVAWSRSDWQGGQ